MKFLPRKPTNTNSSINWNGIRFKCTHVKMVHKSNNKFHPDPKIPPRKFHQGRKTFVISVFFLPNIFFLFRRYFCFLNKFEIHASYSLQIVSIQHHTFIQFNLRAQKIYINKKKKS